MSSTGMGNTLGTLPPGWNGLPLKRWVAVKITDGPHETPAFVDDGIPFISAEAMQDGRINFDAKRGFVSPESHEQYCRKLRPQRDDVFLCKSGATTGKVAIVETDAEFSVWSPLALVRTDRGKMLPKFIYFALHADYLQDQVKTTWTHGTQPNISMGAIERLYVVAPDVRRQAQLVRLIDAKTAKIDSLIAKKERLIELLQEKRAALISHAVTRGLNPKVPMKDSGVEWLQKIPQSWTMARNKSLFHEVDDRSVSGEGELLTVSHITGVTRRSEKPDVTMFLSETLEGYKKCNTGDVVVNTMWAFMGALGTAFLPGVVSPSYNVYRLRHHDRMDPRFLDLLYRTPLYKSQVFRYSKGIWHSRLRLYPEAFFEIVTVVPPLPEQRSIVEYVGKVAAKENRELTLLQESIDRLREYRTALISAAVTGKIDVREEVA